MAKKQQATRSAVGGGGRAGPKPAKAPSIFTRWPADHHYALVQSWHHLAARPVATAMTLSVIAIALALPATLIVLLTNLDRATEGWGEAGQITVFLEAGSTEDQANAMAGGLTADAAVDSVDTLSPDQALADFQALEVYDPALDLLDENPLPWTLLITPRPDAEPGELERLLAVLDVEPQVEMAQFDRQWFARAKAVLAIAHRVTWLLGILLGLAVVLIVGNTIRVGIENRRAEIDISRYMGASDGFVRRPFLYGGLWQGVLGGLLAWLLVVVALLSLHGPVARLGDTYGEQPFALTGLGATGSLTLVGVAVTLGVAGSWLAVSRHLSTSG